MQPLAGTNMDRTEGARMTVPGSPRVWQLLHHGVKVADLVIDGGDWPWEEARVDASEAFEALRPMFAEETRLLDADDPSWDDAYIEIRRNFTLLGPDGRPTPEFLLHIEGDRAWWRYSDVPFDGDDDQGNH